MGYGLFYAAALVFLLPIILGILLVSLLSERSQADRTNRFLGLGRGRIAKGYLGALSALLLLVYIYWVPNEFHFWRQVSFILFFLFVYAIPLTSLLTVIWAPLMSVLHKFGYLSVVGLVCISMACVIALSLLFGAGTKTGWLSLISAVLALAFSLAARLPLLRSPPAPAHSSSSPQNEEYTWPT
jgi:hypothetical protein